LFDGESVATGEIFDAQVQPLQTLRASARIHPAVSDLPHLFPGIGQSGQDSRRGKGELVNA
jgi:hypothetical protein